MVEGFVTISKENLSLHGLSSKIPIQFFLQETYSTPDIENEWKFQWQGKMLFAHGTNHTRGVLILFNNELHFEIKSEYIDTEGRYILVEATRSNLAFYTHPLKVVNSVNFSTTLNPRWMSSIQIQIARSLSVAISILTSILRQIISGEELRRNLQCEGLKN